MQISSCVGCINFPCDDVRHDLYIVPDIETAPEEIRLVLVSEAAPANLNDYYYAAGKSIFQETTLLAFQDAGLEVNTTRVFPSYLQAGPSFFIEKSKRKMIAEDIASALQLIGVF